MDSIGQPPPVLIATLGSKPQLITLALDCLHQDGITPSSVVMVHTRRGRRETDSALTVLASEFQETYPTIELRSLELQQKDVTAPDEVNSAFKALYAEVRTAKRSNQIVHLLIGGGRRTLAVFGMAVAQMLFDDRDHLWHIASHPNLEASGNLHVGEGEWLRLIPIPVIPWIRLSPVFDILREVDDPLIASQRLSASRLREQWDMARIFILTRLTAGENQVVELLVRNGQNQNEIAEQLALSPRTVEQHLRSAYRKAAEHWDLDDIGQLQLMRLLGIYYSYTPRPH